MLTIEMKGFHYFLSLTAHNETERGLQVEKIGQFRRRTVLEEETSW